MKNVLAIIGAILLVFLIIGALAGGYDVPQPLETQSLNAPAPRNQVSPPTETDYSPESDSIGSTMRAQFMEGCVETPSDQAYCTCTFNFLDRKLTNTQFIKIAEDANNGKFPDIMLDALEHCFDTL